jgi:hypothetical protein
VAGVDEISSLYQGGRTAVLADEQPVLRYQDHDISCHLRTKSAGTGSHGLELVNIHVILDPAVNQMIAERRRALQESAMAQVAKKQREEEAQRRMDAAQRTAKAQEKAVAEREARVTKIREHLAIALKLARKDDLDGAEKAMDQVKEINSVDDEAPLGEGDHALLAEVAAADAVIAATPKAKRRAREREREDARQEKERQREEAGQNRERAAADRAERFLQGMAGIEVKPDAAESHSLAEWVVLMTIGGRGQCRQARLSGTVLADLGKQNYEVLVDLPMSLWGGGDDNEGRSLHVLLHTIKTTFRSGGFMSVCTLSRYRLSESITTRGFRRKTLVLTEDPTPSGER